MLDPNTVPRLTADQEHEQLAHRLGVNPAEIMLLTTTDSNPRYYQVSVGDMALVLQALTHAAGAMPAIKLMGAWQNGEALAWPVAPLPNLSRGDLHEALGELPTGLAYNAVEVRKNLGLG